MCLVLLSHISLTKGHNALIPNNGDSMYCRRLAGLLFLSKQYFQLPSNYTPKGRHLIGYIYSSLGSQEYL